MGFVCLRAFRFPVNSMVAMRIPSRAVVIQVVNRWQIHGPAIMKVAAMGPVGGRVRREIVKKERQMQKYEGRRAGAGALVLGIILMGAAKTQAVAVAWDFGGAPDTSFNQPLNWNPDGVPVNTNTYNMSVGGTVSFANGNTNSVQNIVVNGGTVFDMTGGNLSLIQIGNTIRMPVGSGGASGEFNQSGGTLDCGHLMVIGWNAPGVYNLSGGTMKVSRGGNTLQGSAIGPSLSIGTGSAVAALNITGGALTTRVGVEIGPNAVFHVSGSAPTQIGIGSHGDSDGFMELNAGTLKFGIDSGGVTKILIDEVDGNPASGGNGVATFDAGSKLDVSFLGTPKTNAWVILEAEGGIVDNGLALATGVDSRWAFGVTTNQVDKVDVLWVGYAGAVYGPPAPPVSTTNLYVNTDVAGVNWYFFDYDKKSTFTSSSPSGYSVVVANGSQDQIFPAEIQKFSSGFDMSEIGQELTAEFDVVMTAAVADFDKDFRFGFFDTSKNVQIISMNDLGAISGSYMTSRIGNQISYNNGNGGVFVSNDYATLCILNSTSLGTVSGTKDNGLVQNELNHFKCSIERTGTNEIILTTVWMDSSSTSTCVSVIDEATTVVGLAEYIPSGGYGTFNGFGLQIHERYSAAKYTLSNFKLSYATVLPQGFGYNVSKTAVDVASGDVTLTLSDPVVSATYVVWATDDLLYNPMREVGSYVAKNPGTLTIPAAALSAFSGNAMFFDVSLPVTMIVE